MADVIGMRVRDPNTGVITLDITERLTRLIGIVYSGTSPGAIAVPDFAIGEGWAAIVEGTNPNGNLFSNVRYPRIIISGTVLSWDFPGLVNDPIVPCNIIYGVY